MGELDTALFALSDTEKADSLARIATAVWVALEGPMMGRIIGTTPAADRLFGYPEGTLIGQPLDILIPQRYKAVHSSHVAGFARAPEDRQMGGQTAKLFGITKQGVEFPVEIGLSPQFIRSRRSVVATITVARTIHEQ